MFTTPVKTGSSMLPEPPGGEGGDVPEEVPQKKDEDKKPGLFKRLFGHKPEEEKDEKDKKKPVDKKDEKRQQ